MSASTALTCVRCRQPSRPFPEEVVNGQLDIQPEAPFTGRLAYKCTKCARIFCARCCHPAALVKEMLQPGRFSLPEEFTGPHPKAACRECRARVEPYDTMEVEFDAVPAFDEKKPLTIGQRVFAAFFALFMLSIGVYCLMGGAWIRGVFWCAAGSAGLWVVFSK